MSSKIESVIDRLSESCVMEMGDIFWDYCPKRDALDDYSDPRDVALSVIKNAMRDLVDQVRPGS